MGKFNDRMTFNLDNQMPLKEKRVSKVNSQPWFDNTLRNQKGKSEKDRELGLNTGKIINGLHSSRKGHDIIKC